MYKVERYIKMCIDSILNQTFQDFEIIIVDDASPDKSFDICQKLYGNNEKIRIVRHKQNKGLGPSRNTGIENARGKYVYFVDSDDIILPNALEILCNTAKETEADVIHTAAHYDLMQDDDRLIDIKNLIPRLSRYHEQGFLPENLPQRLREHFIPGATEPLAWLNMCKKDFLEKKNLKFIDVISEDEIFGFDLICEAEKFFILTKALYIYRIRQKSIMQTFDSQRFTKGVKFLTKAITYLQQRMDSFAQTAYDKNLQSEVIGAVFNRQNNNHVFPFYNGQNIDPQMDEIIFNELFSVFKENAFLVKHLLNLTNTLQRKNLIIFNQANAILQQNNQLKQMLETKKS